MPRELGKLFEQRIIEAIVNAADNLKLSINRPSITTPLTFEFTIFENTRLKTPRRTLEDCAHQTIRDAYHLVRNQADRDNFINYNISAKYQQKSINFLVRNTLK